MSGSGRGRSSYEEALDANGNAITDGVLTPTPDSQADSEWRTRLGPLDCVDGGPWHEEDSTGTCFRSQIPTEFGVLNSLWLSRFVMDFAFRPFFALSKLRSRGYTDANDKIL